MRYEKVENFNRNPCPGCGAGRLFVGLLRIVGYANDDLYSLHDKTAIARKQQAKAEAEKAAAEARRAEWEARIAEAQAAAAENQYYEYNSNPYEDIVARYVRKRLCTAPAGLRIADIQDAVELL